MARQRRPHGSGAGFAFVSRFCYTCCWHLTELAETSIQEGSPEGRGQRKGEETKLRVLLVYPQYPDTFWSFKHALRVVAKKAAFPPLGLATVAAMLPRLWEMKLTDMNVSP